MNALDLSCKRKRLYYLLTTFLLSLAISLVSIGAALQIGIIHQKSEISNSYVTIAVPAEYRSPSEIQSRLGNNTSTEEVIKAIESVNPQKAYDAAMRSKYVQSVDNRYIMAAQVVGSKSLISCVPNAMQYEEQYDSASYKMAVFAIKCSDVEEMDFSLDELGNPYVSYVVHAEIIDPVSVAEGYLEIDNRDYLIGENGPINDEEDVPELRTIEISSDLYLPDGTIPFQKDCSYLIFGYYQDYPIRTVYYHDHELERLVEKNGRFVTEYGRFFILNDYFKLNYLSNKEIFDYSIEMLDNIYGRNRAVRDSDGKTYFYPNERALPRWSEYNGSWEDFLASNEGNIWREEIIPLCKINHSSATVLLSDNFQSMYAFNIGVAGLLEGRFIKDIEYKDGNDVCMISATYAMYNGYHVGDIITLDLYDSGFFEDVASEGAIISRGACIPERRLNITKEYEIIGIYTAPEFSAGALMFRADTILIPKKSIPNSEAYNCFDVRLLYSIILKNGTQKEFQDYMEQAGYSDAFLYFDQGYDATKSSIEVMLGNAMRILWFGLAMFALTVALTHFLFVRQLKPVARTMRLLGVEPKTIFKQACVTLFIIDLSAVFFGESIATALLYRIAKETLSNAFSPNPLVIVICIIILLVLFVLLSILCARLLSNMPLMQTKKKRRKQ